MVYKGAAPAGQTAAASKQVNMITALPMIKAGRVNAVAVFTEERNPLLPDVPTVVEQGYPQLVGGTWIGLLVSSRTPADRVQKLNEMLNKVLADPETRQALIQLGGNPVGGSPQDFERFIASEKARWEKVIKSAGMTIN